MSVSALVMLAIPIMLFLIYAYMKWIFREKDKAQTKEPFVLIGIDGGCWEIIEPLIDQGKLPNLKNLIREGAYGDLIAESPFSPPSWATIATGLRSRKHGFYHFTVHLRGKHERIFMNYRMMKSPFIWELVESEGKKVGILKWLLLPRYPKNLISRRERNLIALSMGARFLFNILRVKTARHFYSSYEKFRFLRENVNIEWQFALSKYILDKKQPHFFATRISSTDEFQHCFWKYHFPNDYKTDPRSLKKYGSAIGDLYQKIDRFMGELMEKKDRNIIIVSDHGFRGFSTDKPQPLAMFFSLNYNKLLSRLGFLHFKGGRDIVDWKRTKAYWCGDPRSFHELAINLKGREPHGMVSSNDYERIKNELKKALEAIRFEDCNEHLFLKIKMHDGKPYNEYMTFNVLGEESRVWNNDSFDILIEQIHECRFQDPSIQKRKVIVGSRPYRLGEFLTPSVWSAGHSLKGIFIAKGQNIEPVRLNPISTMDIAPNLLFWMNLPIPESMDGKVHKKLFTEEFVVQNPIEFSKAKKTAKYDETALSEKEERKIKEDLENLGYL